MTRLIDADELTAQIMSMAIDKCIVYGDNALKRNKEIFALAMVAQAPTVDAVPIEWILNNERMPKEGRGRETIMDMLEDWRKEHDKDEGHAKGGV